MEEINRTSRTRDAVFKADDDVTSALSGDFRPEGGLFDHFRRAEILLPTEVDAVHLGLADQSLYALRFYVGVNAGASIEVSELTVDTRFSDPVHRLRAWDPTDQFVDTGSSVGETTISAKFSTQQLTELGKLIPGFSESLLPQLDVAHEQRIKREQAPLNETVRTVSNGQGAVVFTLFKNAKTGVDPRQFVGTVIVELPAPPSEEAQMCMSMEVSCRSGALSLSSRIHQQVGVFFLASG